MKNVDLVIIGGGPAGLAAAVAGLAAAFGAPAAGVLFAFEEMKSRRDTSLIVAACASAIGAHLMIRIVFGMGRILPFAGFEAPPLSSFWIVALEGAVFGVLGVGYNKTLLWLAATFTAGKVYTPPKWVTDRVSRCARASTVALASHHCGATVAGSSPVQAAVNGRTTDGISSASRKK